LLDEEFVEEDEFVVELFVDEDDALDGELELAALAIAAPPPTIALIATAATANRNRDRILVHLLSQPVVTAPRKPAPPMTDLRDREENRESFRPFALRQTVDTGHAANALCPHRASPPSQPRARRGSNKRDDAVHQPSRSLAPLALRSWGDEPLVCPSAASNETASGNRVRVEELVPRARRSAAVGHLTDPCGVPKISSCLQIANFSVRAPILAPHRAAVCPLFSS
jgi:hypothetical protein